MDMQDRCHWQATLKLINNQRNMRNIYLILTILFSVQFLFSCTLKNREMNVNMLESEVCIGHVFPETKIENIIITTRIQGEKVTFIEDKFVLKVNKKDLIESIRSDSLTATIEGYAQIFNVVIQYLTKTNDVVLDYVWTKALDFDDISLFEIEKLGERNLTKKVLKDCLCPLLESGKFELYDSKDIQIEKIFSDRIDCVVYGGNVKGFFTLEKELIWICPPFITSSYIIN